MRKFKSYINGEFVGNDFIDIISPITDESCGQVAALNEKDIDHAFVSAKSEFKTWSKVSLEKREGYINEFVKLVNENIDEMAEIMNLEIAKSISDSKTEIIRSVEYIEKTIAAFKKIYKKNVKIGKNNNTIYRVPLGVVLAISPFNYPINLSLAKIIPALISGNTVVFKPATNGSLIGSYMAQLFDKANLPKGVFNLVTGRGRDIGDCLVANKDIAMITFTGGERVGKNIEKTRFDIPLVLELGGNDAAYVRKDADIGDAIPKVIGGAFSFAGQRCTAIKRVVVHKDIEKEFTVKLIEEVKKLDSLPLVDKSAADWVEKLMSDKENKILLGGKRTGNQFENTIVSTTKNSLAWKGEAFGPLLPIISVASDEEAIELINDTNFGLQNSIFSKDIDKAHNIALQLESGSVNINKASARGPDEFPFLGVKNSGRNVQGILEALLSMTRYLNIVNYE